MPGRWWSRPGGPDGEPSSPRPPAEGQPDPLGSPPELPDDAVPASPTPEDPTATGGVPRFPARYVRNVLVNYAAAMVSLVVALTTTPLLTHSLGTARFGVWALVGAMIPYLELLEVGFANVTVATMAKNLAMDDEEGVHTVLNTSFFLLMIPGLIALALAAVLAVVIPFVVHLRPDLVTPARVLLLLLGFDMALSIPFDTFGGGLIALQRFDLLNATLVTVLVLQAVSWFVVLGLGGGLIQLGIVTVVISLGGQLSRYLLLRRHVPRLVLSPRLVDRGLVRSLSGLSGWYSIRQITTTVLGQVDILISGIVVGVASAGVYTVAQRLATLGLTFMSPAVYVYFPHAAQSVGRGEDKRLATDVVAGGRVAVGIVVPTSLVLIALGRPALAAWVGRGYTAGYPVVVLLSVAAVFASVAVAGATIMSGSGTPKVPTIVAAVSAVVHIVLAVVLGALFGIAGVAGALVASVAVFDCGITLSVVARRYSLDAFAYVRSLVRSHIPPVLCAAGLGWYFSTGPVASFVAGHGRAADLAVVTLAGLALLAVYGSVFLFSGLDAAERSAVGGRVRALLGGPAR